MKKEMKQQRKNKIPRIASLALMLTMVTTCLLSGTLAKYTKTVYGADTARVAKFDFGATGLGTAGTSIALFAESYDNDSAVKTVETGTAGEKLVAPGTSGDFTYAFSGESEVSVKLTIDISETNTDNIPIFYEYNGKYYTNYTNYIARINNGETLTLDLSDGGSNPAVAVATVNGNFGGSLTDLATNSATAISTKIDSSGVIPPNTSLSTVSWTAAETKVTWCWPFTVRSSIDSNVSDITIDTPLGVDGTAEIILNMNATATQVD